MRVLLLALALLPLASCIEEAHANPVVDVARWIAGHVVISEAENLDVSCLTSTTAITWASSKAQGFLTCWVDGTTPVYFGAAGVLAANGIPVCEDAACADGGRGIWKSPLAKKSAFGCISSSGTKHAMCTVTFP